MIPGTIEVEIEADAWTAALPEAETVVRRAATALGLEILTSMPSATG